jgi:lysophospholipase L1-like esterase
MIRPQVIRYGDIDKRFPEKDPDSRMYQCKVLAEGDSWFTLGAVPSSNLLLNLQVTKPTALVTIAQPGDTITRMGDPERMLQLRRLLASPQFAYKWDAILLSGGGNDLIDSAPVLLKNIELETDDPADYVDAAALQQLISHVQGAYADIVAVRDAESSQSKGKPIYVHTYDYPTPRDAGARFLGAGVLGPWLYPAFLLADIPESMWLSVSDYLLDQLAEAILALDSQSGSRPLPGVFVVNTLNTLNRARLGTTASDSDWANEIHPNTTGYKKLAEKLSARLNL